MGCDIHPLLEIKIAGDWIFVGSVNSHRSYQIFSRLSGVRSDDEDSGFFKISNNVPEDCSEQIKEWFIEGHGDLHSLTIINLEGLKKFNSENVGLGFYTEGWEKIMTEAMGVCEDVRIIAAYDN